MAINLLAKSNSASSMTRRLSSNSPLSLYLVGPAVKKLISEYDFDPSVVGPTGPKKNLTKGDLLTHINAHKLKPKPVGQTPWIQFTLDVSSTPPLSPSKSKAPANVSPDISSSRGPKAKFVDIPLSNMRSVIAKRLSASKGTIPHAYLSAKIPADNVLEMRKRAAKDGVKLSMNDFVIKAAAHALRAVPRVNSQWKNDAVHQISSIDISVAVATPNGLITPILANADRLGVEEISSRVRELAGRAKENKLKPNEFQGGSFTISNLGMFGISHFTAIINPPQSAILAVGGVETRIDENLRPKNSFSVTLCYDARAIDELSAQRFLDNFQLLLKEPDTMYVGTEKFTDFDLEQLL